MTTILRAMLAFTVGASVNAGLQASPQQEAVTKSLYERLGGYDTIAAVVNDFGRRWEDDPELKPFLTGFSSDSGRRQVQLFIEWLCEQAGGPCAYVGRDMKTVHEGLEITEARWNAFMKVFAASLDAARVPSREKDETLALFAKVKPAVGVK